MLRFSAFLLLAVLLTPALSSDLVVPNFPDLTVKTRTTGEPDSRMGTVLTTWFFKGARQRGETRIGDQHAGYPYIMQCDQRVQYSLNLADKTYVSRPLDLDELRKEFPPKPERQPAADAGEFTVTTDSVDTGERRKVGSYEARHVKTTITAEPSPGAHGKASKTVVDGWYIDLVGMNCRDGSEQGMAWIAPWSGHSDRMIFKQIGKARRGLPIEETRTRTEADHTFVSKTELVEISEAPLDPSLFEIPAGFTLVKRTERNPHH
jgi:hypothetical protein